MGSLTSTVTTPQADLSRNILPTSLSGELPPHPMGDKLSNQPVAPALPMTRSDFTNPVAPVVIPVSTDSAPTASPTQPSFMSAPLNNVNERDLISATEEQRRAFIARVTESPEVKALVERIRGYEANQYLSKEDAEAFIRKLLGTSTFDRTKLEAWVRPAEMTAFLDKLDELAKTAGTDEGAKLALRLRVAIGFQNGGLAGLKRVPFDASAQTILSEYSFELNRVRGRFPLTEQFLPSAQGLIKEIIEIEKRQREEREQAQAQRRATLVAYSNPSSISAFGNYADPLGGAGVLTSSYGLRERPAPGASTDHKGIDLGAPTGTPAYSPISGTIVHAGDYGSGGLTVIVRSLDGTEEHVMHHFSAINPGLEEGQRINAGDFIARVGSTGVSSGPHLHWGIKRNGNWVDPGPIFTALRRGDGIVTV